MKVLVEIYSFLMLDVSEATSSFPSVDEVASSHVGLDFF